MRYIRSVIVGAAGDSPAGGGQCAAFVGRTPLDPLLANGMSITHPGKADEGVGCGPGGPPHSLGRIFGLGKPKWEN